LVLGIDVGSLYSKGVLFDGEIRKKVVVKTSYRPREAIAEIKRELWGYNLIAATGYGRELVTDAHRTITEISAFARGAAYIDRTVRTIIDIGGQDSKVIKLKDGALDRFVMNDRCAAGTGNFIEKMAQALDLTLEEFGALALKSGRPEPIDSLCVVMAETEILSLVSEGKRIEDIIFGICDSLIRRIIGISGQIGIEDPVLFCGGGALNPGLVKALEHNLHSVMQSPIPQYVGALGAALSI